MKIELGALSESLMVQLAGSNIPEKTLDALDRDANAISRLYVRGYMSDSASTKARKIIVGELERLNKYHSPEAVAKRQENTL